MGSLVTISLIIIGLAFLGYLFSKLTNSDPKNLIKYDQLSASVSKNPTWYFPLVVLGVIMSYIINFVSNLVIYALFAVMFLLTKLAELLTWLFNILKLIFTSVIVPIWDLLKKTVLLIIDGIIIPVWELIKKTTIMIVDAFIKIAKLGIEMFTWVLDVLIMFIKIAIRYLITIPLEVLIASINSVAPSLNLKTYFNSVKVLMMASLAAGIVMFTTYLFGMSIIGELIAPFILVIAITYIVGKVTFDSNEAGKKAAKFCASLVGLVFGVLVLLYALNQLDSITSWGGVFAGLWYSPSVLSISLVTIIIISIIYITNVGAIYINTDGANLSFMDQIKGSICESFKRSYSFILQPLFAFGLGLLIVVLPFILITNSANVLNDNIVAPALSSTGTSLKQELAKNKVKDNMGDFTKPEVSQGKFDSSIVKLATEIELERKIEENNRYSAYISKSIISTSMITPVVSSDIIKNEIKASEDLLKSLTTNKSESIKAIDEELVSLDTYKASNASMITPELDSASVQYYTSEGENIDKNILAKKMERERTEKFMNAYILAINDKIDYQNGSALRYNLTYLFFLLGSGILIAVLLTFIINIYAFGVRKVYDMWRSSFIVDQVKEARSKHPLQPWIGLLIIAILFSSSIIKYIPSMSNFVSGENNKELVDDATSDDDDDDDDDELNNSDMNTEGAENIDMPATPEEDYYPIDEEYVDYSDEEYMGD
jgi:hypothetical protein